MSPSKPAVAFKRTNADGDDPVRAPKLAKRFNEAMALALNPNPIGVDLRCIAVSMVNRLFSVRQVHSVIFKSLFKDGHDPLRPAPGILCEVKDPGYMKALLDHNEKLCATPPHAAPVPRARALRVPGGEPLQRGSAHGARLYTLARGGLVQTQRGRRALGHSVH